MSIQAILFDADGVLQRPTVRWRPAFAPWFEPAATEELEAFLADILEAESAFLCASTGFDEALAAVLTTWHRPGRLHDALRVINGIALYEEVVRVAEALQRGGIACHIASNQQASRAAHMSKQLNYRGRFTREFYSCHLGVAKPDRAFFEKVLGILRVDPGEVLFVDDVEQNVQAARQLGIHGVVLSGASGAPAVLKALAARGLKME